MKSMDVFILEIKDPNNINFKIAKSRIFALYPEEQLNAIIDILYKLWSVS